MSEPVPSIGGQEFGGLQSQGDERPGMSLFGDEGGPRDESWSNASDGPALTLVLPDEGEGQVSGAAPPGEAEAAADDDACALESMTGARQVEPPVSEPSVSEPPMLLSTTDLPPISRPSRFFAPHEGACDGVMDVGRPALWPREPVSAPSPAAVSEPISAPPAAIAAATPAVEVIAAAQEPRPSPPLRVGSGQLQPSRSNWKPGDPFGDGRAGEKRFRWELMLTTACGTAACGLAGIWLLRTLLS